MWKFTLELLCYVSFVGVLYLISYLNHGTEEFYQVQHLRSFLLNLQNETRNYSKIVSIEDYWNWLEESFIDDIYVGDWYNGQEAENLNGYLNDKASRLIGWATIRQLRVKKDSCRVKASMQALISSCDDEYSFGNEERRSYLRGWNRTNGTRHDYNSSIDQAFVYRSSDEIDTYIYLGEHATYRSGGYVYEFRGTLNQTRADLLELHQLEWIDKQTRAVLIQMNLYNPSIPIFTSAIIIIELLPSSGVFPSARFEPLYFNSFQSVFQIVCAVIYLIFITYFLVMEIRSFIHLRKAYFSQFWSYIELGVIVCSWAGVGIHLWRRSEATRILKLFRLTRGDVYVNFQLIAYINDIFSFLMAFCCFFGTLRLLRLCRYNRRLALLGNTLKRAIRELISFSFMFSIIFMAFLTLFYLQFVSQIWECSSLLHTAQMLFEMLLLKFDTSEFLLAEPYLGPIYFTLFILFVVFVCINMFVSIINDNFRVVRDNVHKVDDDEQDLFITILKKLQRWWTDGTEQRVAPMEIVQQAHVIHVAEMSDPLTRLAKKLDQLTVVVNKRYNRPPVHIAWNETTVSSLDWIVE